MASPREHALDMIQALPDDATLDDILEELYFKLEVDAGLRELDEGKGIPHEEVEARLAKWLQR